MNTDEIVEVLYTRLIESHDEYMENDVIDKLMREWIFSHKFKFSSPILKHLYVQLRKKIQYVSNDEIALRCYINTMLPGLLPSIYEYYDNIIQLIKSNNPGVNWTLVIDKLPDSHLKDYMLTIELLNSLNRAK